MVGVDILESDREVDEEEIKVIDPPQLKLLLSKGVDLNRKI